LKNVGYGKGYAYDHATDEAFSGQIYWPEEMEAQTLYEPTDRGFEARIRERIEYWNERRKELQQSDGEQG
jgi:putative ATPase